MNNTENKVIVITGASDGIGAEAARELHALGAKVVIIGRSPQKTSAVAKAIGCDYFIADFTVLSEVRHVANALLAKYPRIDVLVNNAGGIFGKRQITVDGHETTFQVNHLAHFLLTRLLENRLIGSNAIIINTSSIAHRIFSKFKIEDLDMATQYTPNMSYGNSKLANILFTKELARRLQHKGVAAVSFHPGNVTTNFASNTTSVLRLLYRTPLKYVFRLISPKQGADTLVWLVTSTAGVDWETGGYYYKRSATNVLEAANDPVLAESLWKQSEAMINHYL